MTRKIVHSALALVLGAAVLAPAAGWAADGDAGQLSEEKLDKSYRFARGEHERAYTSPMWYTP